jgi:hypothetical protein
MQRSNGVVIKSEFAQHLIGVLAEGWRCAAVSHRRGRQTHGVGDGGDMANAVTGVARQVSGCRVP